jgi:hypothetical protein
VIDTTTNQPLPILKLSAADPTENFYVYEQFDWDTGLIFSGTGESSRHLTMRAKRAFLSRIFIMILFMDNDFLTDGCIRIKLVAAFRRQDLGEGVCSFPSPPSSPSQR